VSAQQRLGSGVRSCLIAGFLVAYGLVLQQPGASFEISFLVSAVLQVAVIVLRRVVPADFQAEALQVFELVADAASVVLFALGVFGGIAAGISQF
jgi:hypothetical protein